MVKGSVDYCVKRSLQFAKYADLLWMETPSPSVQVAREYAEGIKKIFPSQMFGYNLSPSFNWNAAGLSELEI